MLKKKKKKKKKKRNNIGSCPQVPVDRKHKIHPILFPHQSRYVMPNHLSKSYNRKASPFRAVGVLKGTIIEKWIWLTAAEKMNEHVELGVQDC